MNITDPSIAERRTAVIDAASSAAKSANRAFEDINLVAVSKQQPDERIKDMLATEHRVFGENRVQEAQVRWGDTFASHRKNIELRLIGPLQTNKAEDACRLFDVIETVDREKLLAALVKAADKTGRMPRLYVQVNTGEEPQKAGVLPADLPAFLNMMKDAYNLTPEGLMCIPPQNEAPSPHFWFLKNLAAEHGLTKLSMGMSSDYETAIKLGATSVRVGSALFGERP
ncbi:MAG: YggS family pyridoxal phosphate-dependent enzyme [Maricaulaceae bacterium]